MYLASARETARDTRWGTPRRPDRMFDDGGNISDAQMLEKYDSDSTPPNEAPELRGTRCTFATDASARMEFSIRSSGPPVGGCSIIGDVKRIVTDAVMVPLPPL